MSDSPSCNHPVEASEAVLHGACNASEHAEASLSEVFGQCRDYLMAIAAKSMEPNLRTKVSTADLLQQTFLEAHRDLHHFHGDSAAQLRAWLRRIMLNNIANSRRRFNSAKRNIKRESPEFKTPSLKGREKTPSSIAAKQEELALLQIAMQSLSPEHRQVIQMRNLDRKSFSEIGCELERSEEAASKLWFRAMKSLKKKLSLLRDQPPNNAANGRDSSHPAAPR